MIKVHCENLNRSFKCNPGTTLSEFAQLSGVKLRWPILAAIVDNQLKELGFNIYISHNVRFIDFSHSDGARTYSRSLNFVFQKAVAEFFPKHSLVIDYNLQSGMYAEVRELELDQDGSPVALPINEDQLVAVKNRMQELIDADLPFTRQKIRTEEAAKMFRANNRPEKASLNELRGKFFTTVYFLDGYPDHFYGPLLESTGKITAWDLEIYNSGMVLRSPSITNPYQIVRLPYQSKLFEVFKEYSNWCSVVGAHSVASVNDAIIKGLAPGLIQLSEALHERKYTLIADEIFKRRDKVKLILIAGPSSSGKTSTSKRVALQAKVLGLNPVIIEMDNYFVDRDKTPRDADGNYDFEVLEALDVDFLNEQLNDLLEGKSIEVPKFNFEEGKRFFTGERLSMQEKDILIMEGIHGLNPKLTSHIPKENIFKIYASALTSLSLDENNSISTSDSRLLRRIVRDGNFRGMTPESTILRWSSVRRGEINNIFPYQENADIMFNSALLAELGILKQYAEPILREVPESEPEYAEAVRLMKFLSYFKIISEKDIPPTSILREFFGGSSFRY